MNEISEAAKLVIPHGWVLVPVNPTPEMIQEAEMVEDLYRRGTPQTWAKVYRTMIKFAPIYSEGK